MDTANQSPTIGKLRQIIIAVLVVAALFLVANLVRYERLDSKPCPYDQFCYTVFDRWQQHICYVFPGGTACSKGEARRLKYESMRSSVQQYSEQTENNGQDNDLQAFKRDVDKWAAKNESKTFNHGLITYEEAFPSSYSITAISAIIVVGAIIALIALRFWKPKKREQENKPNSQDLFHPYARQNLMAAFLSLYLSIRSLWIDEITDEDQARRIVRRSSRYAFWYWFLSASLFNSQTNKMKPHLRTIDPALLTSFEAMILSPAFVFGAGVILISALTCCYIMKKKDSRAAATLLLILWTFQAWLRATYLQPNLIWTPLFIFVVWTTARGLLATHKMAIFKKNPKTGRNLMSSKQQKEKQLNPWDRRPWPSKGNDQITTTYEAVGRFLSCWERYEGLLSLVFSYIVANEDTRAARYAYNSVRTFEGRMSMLKAASIIYFLEKPDEETQKKFKELVSQATQFSQRRNDIAHGVVDHFHPYPPSPKQFPLETYCLYPSYANQKDRDYHDMPMYRYTSVELDYFYAEVFLLNSPALELAQTFSQRAKNRALQDKFFHHNAAGAG